MKSEFCIDYDARIETLLKNALAQIAKEAADSKKIWGLEFLVLGGGYGRGEGGLMRKPDGSCALYNDLDFFVIAKDDAKDSDLKNLDENFSEISKIWTKKLGIDVDFGPATRCAYIAKRLDMLMWREMAFGAKVILGDEKTFRKNFCEKLNADIPARECLKLLFNRLYGLQSARQLIWDKTGEQLTNADFDFIARNINKSVLACGDAILIKNKSYTFLTSDKIETLKNICSKIEYSPALPKKVGQNDEIAENTHTARTENKRGEQIQSGDKNADSKILHAKDFHEQLFERFLESAAFKKNPAPLKDAKIQQKRANDTADLALQTIHATQKYFTACDTFNLKILFKNIVKNIRLRKLFNDLDEASTLLDYTKNPHLRALKILKKFLSKNSPQTPEVQSKLTRLWRKIN